uniref:Uncharacterized protein n=1 Tax=Leersia perrieri TaxID=77586 RepID=A0A0D9WPM2_9ORYZ
MELHRNPKERQWLTMELRHNLKERRRLTMDLCHNRKEKRMIMELCSKEKRLMLRPMKILMTAVVVLAR